MADKARVTALAQRMRSNAKLASEISERMAREKSLRQPGHNPPRDDLYSWAKPEQTIEWEIADLLDELAATK